MTRPLATLSADILRARFCCDAHIATTETLASIYPDHARAAVLIPIVERSSGMTVLFTRRTDHLYHHPGQISFPGGGVEEDDRDDIAAALRETEEEVGLPASSIEVVGRLPGYATVTGYSISPIVGLAREPLLISPDSFEVAEVFEVPFDFLTNPLNYQRHRIEQGSTLREFYAVPYGGRFIWGATAGMLATLCAFLGHPIDTGHSM